MADPGFPSVGVPAPGRGVLPYCYRPRNVASDGYVFTGMSPTHITHVIHPHHPHRPPTHATLARHPCISPMQEVEVREIFQHAHALLPECNGPFSIRGRNKHVFHCFEMDFYQLFMIFSVSKFFLYSQA